MNNELLTGRSAWIWLDASDEPNRFLETELSFSAKKGQSAQLHLTVEGQYVAFVNGARVNSTQHSDFPFAKSVQTPDVSDLLIDGENALFIQCWYAGTDTSVTRKELPGLRFELVVDGEIVLASGEDTPIRPIAEYVDGEIHNITGQLGAAFGRRFAAPAEWKNACVVEKPATFVPRPVKELNVAPAAPSRIFAQGWFKAVDGKNVGERMQNAGLFWRDVHQMTDIPRNYQAMTDGVNLPSEEGVTFRADEGDGIWLLVDMNALHEGFLSLDLTTPENCKVELGWGEHCEDMRLRTSVGGRCFAVELVAGPERKPFEHWFRRLGGRYLQLYIHSREATVYTASVHPATYPLDQKPIIVPDDRLHRKIAEISRDTLIACMHDHYEDCPWREQALYAFDSRNQMLAGYYAFGEFDFARENLRLLAHSQREDGMLELCAPARIPITIPMFSLIFVVSLEDYCRYSGDLAFGREMVPVCEGILNALLIRVEDKLARRFKGKQYWNFYEWQPILEGYYPDVPEDSAEAGLQLFGILALQRMASLRKMLGMETCEKEDAALADLIEGLEMFWDEEQQAYASFIWNGEKVQYAELMQSLALYAKVCPEGRRKALQNHLLNGGLVTVTLSHSLFKYESLLQEPELAERVFDEIAERWGTMLFKGATTFWEVEDGAAAFDRAGSLCHAWCSIPLYLYMAYAMGIRPGEPGKWTTFEPIAGGFTGRATLRTPEGYFEVKSIPGMKSEMTPLG